VTAAQRAPGPAWWVGATIYHAYVRSFKDSDGDGYGDLAGLEQSLDYLAGLGVRGLWLSPTMPSPNRDWGYDVSDYYGVQTDLGSLSDLDRLIDAGRRRGIRLLLDLVPNHTSSQHPWFVSARSSKSSPYRDYYVWADGQADGSPPNNWIDDTGEIAWTWDEATQQYYLHNFLSEQPDLNWWNPRVHEEFDKIISYWLDRGVAGFRIDVANGLYKDKRLRDNPRDERGFIYDTEVQGRYGLQHLYNFNQPEVHEVYRHWRSEGERRPEKPLFMGETWVARVDELAPYYGDNDELQLAINFPLVFAPFQPRRLAQVAEDTFAALPPGASPAWAGSNHDLPRLATRWAGGDQRKVRLALTVLAMLPGTWILYYGDELGMPDSDIPSRLQRDPLTMGGLNGQWPRDNARAPMRWDDTAQGGFTAGVPWLPVHPDPAQNVRTEQSDPASTLHLVRALIALRAELLSAADARYQTVAVSDARWVFASGPCTIAANFTERTVPVTFRGRPLLSSKTITMNGAEGSCELDGWEAVVVAGEVTGEF
jgi:alpha-glucosidase